MKIRIPRPSAALLLLLVAILFGVLVTLLFRFVSRGYSSVTSNRLSQTAASDDGQPAAKAWGLPTMRPPGAPRHTPTPDALHALPTLRAGPEQYVVQPGDTLMLIAERYGLSIEQIANANELANPDVLSVGQALTIPAPTAGVPGVDFKIIPDSELVFGPSNILLDIEAFAQEQGGYLSSYYEEANGSSLSGAQVVDLVARQYSVSARLLLAILERQSGWLTQATPDDAARVYPIGLPDPDLAGLYRQLSWAANNLNRGFYLWRVDGVATWALADGSVLPVAPTINAGTAGVQHLYTQLYDRAGWNLAVSAGGLFAVYDQLFGYPFDYAIEPAMPPGLTQPVMQLPFEDAVLWAFTSGPHGTWGNGSAWGALDFAPPGDQPGCIRSDDWVVAVADGLIVRAGDGAVIQDLDGDGYEQTGWVVLYMHIESRQRVQPGTYLKTGERIGHPSCEGGLSTGTHVHIARRYNGEWIPADQQLPFVLDGWVSIGSGVEYDGFLRRDGQSVEAYAGRNENNIIGR